MTTSVIELSKRLQRSLDSNYNVIDSVAVFEIIRTLEGTPITTEQLETTRLAKYINQLRRKTTNEQLARQAKNLLKKWRDNLMPAIASGSQPTPAAAPAPAVPMPAAVAPVTTNGMPPVVRSQPTTPSRPVLQQQNHHPSPLMNHHHHNQTSSSCEKVITIPDHDDNDSKSLGSSHLISSRGRPPPHPAQQPVSHRGVGGGSNSGSTGVMGSGGGGGVGSGLTIPTELTNFYLKNKKIIDGSDVRVVVKEESAAAAGVDMNNHAQPFAVDELDPGDVDARDRHKRKGRKRGAKGFDNLIGGSTGSLYNSNSNSGFPGDSNAAAAATTTTSTTTAAATGPAGTAASTVGKKVKTTRQLVADLKIRNEQNLRNASYPDLSNEQEHNNNNNNGMSSSPMSASNDSQQHLFHHHHHNQHLAGHDHMVFHSAPVTPSGVNYAAAAGGVKREVSPSGGGGDVGSASARKREKKRRKLEKERQAAAAAKLRVKKREKTPPPASGLNFLNQVDEDIWQLKNKLPPIDRKAILRQIKAETLAHIERQCTCEMVECSQEEAEEAAGVVYASLDDIPAMPTQVLEDEAAVSASAGASASLSKSEMPSTSAAAPASMASLPPTKTVNVVRNKRSIFDDDDVVMDDQPPSPAAIDKNNNSEEEGTSSREERLPPPRQMMMEQHQQQQHHTPPPPPVPVIIVPPNAGDPDETAMAEEEEERVFYKFIEHPDCPIKRRKHDLLRLNADYHLAALHQLYVPGVNGNWSAFPDLAILKRTQSQHMRELIRARKAAKKQQQLMGRKRKRSSSDSSEDDEDEENADHHHRRHVYTGENSGPDNSELLKCWERLQDRDTESVESVVPLVNPFFYFLKAPSLKEEREKEEAAGAVNILANMAGRLPRYVPLRTDFGMVIVPPEMPEGGEPPPPPPATPPAIQFNRELAKELGIEAVCEGLKGDVYEPRELEKFLEAMLVQRLPKFQMANLFYKRSWPGAEDRGNNLSLELLNSLYLNRVLEFRRRGRSRGTAHRKRRRKSGEAEEEEEEMAGVEEDQEAEEVEVNDVLVFDGFLEMQTMAFRNSSGHSAEENGGGQSSSSMMAIRSARRLFYVNDDRMFGHQPSILDEIVEGGDNPLPVLEDEDLFRVRWQALEFLPPVLSVTARTLYSSWPRMRWNFLLDYFKDRQQHETAMMVDDADNEEDGEGGEVVRIHENNFCLPSFNRLTEENLLGIRQRRGRRLRRPSQGEEEEDDEELRSVLPGRVKCRVESYRERDFVRVCMDKWPQLFEGISFDYEKGVLQMSHRDVDTRWRFLCEFRELLREVTRLGVVGEEEDEDDEELLLMKTGHQNGFSSAIKEEASEEGDSDREERQPRVGAVLQEVDEPQVELFKEWHESVQVQSYNDELLTILPYVVID